MTNRQAAVIASRTLCAWFIYSAILGLGALPAMVTALAETAYLGDALSSPLFAHRMVRIILIPALSEFFRLIVNVAAAVFFYRCGPRVVEFFIGGAKEAEGSE